jgi:hypothetical protein
MQPQQSCDCSSCEKQAIGEKRKNAIATDATKADGLCIADNVRARPRRANDAR